MGRGPRPAWVPLLAATAAFVLFCGLGVWQVQRAGEKRALIARIERGAAAPVRALPADADELRRLAYARVRARGEFRAQRQFLLDNRIHEGRPGYDVLTPLVLADGRTVLVDRGWVPAGPRREPQVPVALAAAGPVTVSGRLSLPEPGIALGPALAPGGGWPHTITRVDYAALERALGRELVPAVIRADGDAPWVLQPRGLEPAFGPMRHYGYAVQWFALALTVVVVTGALSWRRRRGERR